MSPSRELAPILKSLGVSQSFPSSSFIRESQVQESLAVRMPPAGLNPIWRKWKVNIHNFHIFELNQLRPFATLAIHICIHRPIDLEVRHPKSKNCFLSTKENQIVKTFCLQLKFYWHLHNACFELFLETNRARKKVNVIRMINYLTSRMILFSLKCAFFHTRLQLQRKGMWAGKEWDKLKSRQLNALYNEQCYRFQKLDMKHLPRSSCISQNSTCLASMSIDLNP